MHVRVIQDNQRSIMEVLQRIELGMHHPQATTPATTNFLPMAPNMLPLAHNPSLSRAHNTSMPVAHTSLPMATNSSLPMVPSTPLPVPSNTSPSMVPNTSLCMRPTTPLPAAPVTACPCSDRTRESPSEPGLILDSTTTPNHPEPFGLNHTVLCLQTKYLKIV